MSSIYTATTRNQSGNLTVLTVVFLIAIILPILFFGLSYLKIMASYQGQKSAIDVASLSVAQDLGTIVIEDANVGFISLSDFAPNGSATLATDGYPLTVRSINSLLATTRLELILADKLTDPILVNCANADYNRVMTAKTALVTALQAAVAPGGSAMDKDGNIIRPYDKALNAYNAVNIKKMVDGTTNIKANSLTIELGYVEDLVTNMPIPRPAVYAELSSADQEGGFYKSGRNIPYQGKAFVFAAGGNSAALVDFRRYKSTIAGLPYQIPTVVCCRAEQVYNETDAISGSRVRSVTATSCARPACLVDTKPKAGLFGISGGVPLNMTPYPGNFYQLLTHIDLYNCPADAVYTPINDDYPISSTALIAVPELSNRKHPPFGHLMRLAFFDWLRKAGPCINVSSMFTAMQAPADFTAVASTTAMSIDRNGVFTIVAVPFDPLRAIPASHKQLYAVTGGAFPSANGAFDVFLKDQVRNLGRVNGGKHGGEPLANIQANSATTSVSNRFDENVSGLGTAPNGPGGTTIRPSYTATDAIAVELKFRERTLPPLNYTP